MKNGKYIAILIIGVLVIIGVILAIALTTHNPNKVLENEYAQRELLSNIYMEIKQSDKINIILDESALKNIVTGETFSNDTINYLKMVETPNNEFTATCTLSISYHVKTGTLGVGLLSDHTSTTLRYKISIENGKLKYKSDGVANKVSF